MYKDKKDAYVPPGVGSAINRGNYCVVKNAIIFYTLALVKIAFLAF